MGMGERKRAATAHRQRNRARRIREQREKDTLRDTGREKEIEKEKENVRVQDIHARTYKEGQRQRCVGHQQGQNERQMMGGRACTGIQLVS